MSNEDHAALLKVAARWEHLYKAQLARCDRLQEADSLLAKEAAFLLAENVRLRAALDAMTELAKAAFDDALPPDELIAKLRAELAADQGQRVANAISNPALAAAVEGEPT